MRGFFGLCLLIAGLSIGAYSHYPGSAHREASLVELTEIVTGAIHKPADLAALTPAAHTAEPTNRPAAQAPVLATPAAPAAANGASAFQRRGWFANANILARDGLSSRDSTPPARAAAHKQPQARTLTIAEPPTLIRSGTAQASRQPRGSGGWRTAIVRVDAAPASAGKRSGSLTTKTYGERLQLVKAIQSHLKRVGCYWGRIDGIWGKGSKWAMADFMRAVNAALPTQDPDYIQLKLVASQGGKVCGRKDTQTQVAARTPPPVAQSAVRTKWRAKIARVDAAPRGDNRARMTTGAIPPQLDVADIVQQPRRAPLPGRMAVGVLQSPPKLATRPAARQKRVKVSALVQPDADIRLEGRQQALAVENTDSSTPRRNVKRAPQINPFVAEQRSTAKVQRAKALRKASIRKKKRRRYRKRRYRRRSIQSMFTHPLGRR